MIEDADFSGINIFNIDNCELIIEKMIERQQNNRLKANNGTTTSKKKNKSPGCNNNSKGKKQITVDKPMEEGSGVCEYMVMSVEDLKFEDNSFDCVLDKGCLDALLSTGQDEQGTNEVIQQMMRELFRVLKPNGKVFIFSKNDDFIVNPYFFFDESISWNVEMKSLERKAKRGDAGLEGCNAAMLAKSFYFYLLTAEKEKTWIKNNNTIKRKNNKKYILWRFLYFISTTKGFQVYREKEGLKTRGKRKGIDKDHNWRWRLRLTWETEKQAEKCTWREFCNRFLVQGYQGLKIPGSKAFGHKLKAHWIQLDLGMIRRERLAWSFPKGTMDEYRIWDYCCLSAKNSIASWRAAKKPPNRMQCSSITGRILNVWTKEIAFFKGQTERIGGYLSTVTYSIFNRQEIVVGKNKLYSL